LGLPEEEAVRFVGMFLLGLGVVFLIPSCIFLVTGPQPEDVAPFVCLGLVSVLLVAGGIAIIRRAEDGAGKEEGAEWSDPGPTARGPWDLVGRVRAGMRGMDLNRLNWVGWLLLLATIGFMLGEAAVLARLLGDPAWGGRVVRRLTGLGMLLLGARFFAGLRWLLRLLGVSIYRW
jgi:hypothetical protein